ncbi:hypothetical protein K435DRAFT_871734 [Dendrothele bispora CBS 962.96]|uniref:Uncharacterized protein n=1 Tax=Dendrothele bispora (strain CBS 962.96) TaxID=1314807 RepID=A0A4S8L3D8_DENBC|nr:hypothetical protein K435DRAFT_871734 [Dendrothele bispora CBS 962.96]
MPPHLSKFHQSYPGEGHFSLNTSPLPAPTPALDSERELNPTPENTLPPDSSILNFMEGKHVCSLWQRSSAETLRQTCQTAWRKSDYFFKSTSSIIEFIFGTKY